MDIISLRFIVITIASALLYSFLHQKYRGVFLALMSSLFLLSHSISLLLYVFIYVGLNYFVGIQIVKAGKPKMVYRIGILVNILQLIILRYASFAIDPLFNLFNSEVAVSKLSEIIVTLGISYYTLQSIGYLFNIKMKWEKPEYNFIDFFVYLTFFPKFISGPIERSNHFLPQLKSKNSFNEENIFSALWIILTGFFKKVAIANQLAPYVVDTFANIETVDGFSLWALIFLLPAFLYFDFSGYTDIAIGCAKLFGINLLPNFNRPFFAESMTNFWKRFHISLSAWFNDYIFKQTSFRRRKWGMYTSSVYAVLLTWVLFGIWHGAGWNFMLLGFLQAIAIIYEFFTKKIRKKLFSKLPDSVAKWIGRISVYLFYGCSLVFFFSPNLKSTYLVFVKLFTFTETIPTIVIKLVQQVSISVFVFMIIVYLAELIQEDFNDINNLVKKVWLSKTKKSLILRWTVYSMILTILFVLANNVQPFIYSQF